MTPDLAQRILQQWINRIIDDGVQWGIIRGFHRLTLTIDDPQQKQTMQVTGTVNDALEPTTHIKITGEEQ